MDTGRVNSLKRRLMRRQAGQLNLVVDELLREDEPIPAELLQVIISSYVAGNQITNLSLAKLIVKTKDQLLYAASIQRGTILFDVDALCR